MGADLIVFQCHVNICISGDFVHTACSCFLKFGVSAFREEKEKKKVEYAVFSDVISCMIFSNFITACNLVPSVS